MQCQEWVNHIPITLGRICTRKFCDFYIIFHSIVQTNMKQKFVSRIYSSTTIKQYIYPVIVLSVMPVCY